MERCRRRYSDLFRSISKPKRNMRNCSNRLDFNLQPFKSHGGKMIQYAGWADTAIAPENGLNYCRAVERTIGDPHDFYRVFMVPGMAHRSGGAGPNSFGNGTATGR